MSTPHTHILLRLALVAGFALILGSVRAADFTSTWNGGNANWTSTGNWSTPGAPGTFPNNGGSTYDAIQNAGILTLDQNIAIQKFTMGGGVLTGTNNLTTNDTFTWNGGIIQGSGSVNLNGGLILGNAAVTLTNSRVMNLASGQTAAMSGASTVFNLSDTATFNNNGTFLAQNNQSINSGSAPSTFNNVGTFTRDTGTGTFSISSRFNNSGIVNVNTGTLALDFYSGTAGGFSGTTTGDFNVASGATLRFSDGYTLGATSDVTGAGSVVFASGTVNVNGSFTVPTVSITGGTANLNGPVTLSSVTLSSGNLGGSGTVTSNGSFNWSGGQMMGSGTTTLNGGITLGNASLRITDSRVVTLASGQTAAMSSSSTAITIGTTGTFNNNGTFLAQNNQSITGDGSGQSFNNAGTFTRNTSSGTFNIADVNFTNTGTINADTGTLNLAGFYGTYNQQAGTVTGAGIINAQKMNWSGGTFSGTGALNVSGGGNTITTTGAKGLDRTLNNTGTITFTGTLGSGGQIEFGVGNSTPGIINNSGTVNLSNGAGFEAANANAAHAINNSGTWNVSGSFTNTVNTGIKFNNSGAVNVANNSTFVTLGGGTQTGSFTVGSGGDLWLIGSDLNSGSSVTGAGKVTLGGTTINSGSTYSTTGETSLRGGVTQFNTSATTGSVSGGTNQAHLVVSGSGTTLKVNGAFTNNTQYTTLEGGAIIETTAFNLNGGELNGNGSINGPLTSNGTIAPGASPGGITVNGNTILGSNSILNMQIGAGSPVTNYDVLTVNGTVMLDGELRLAMLSNFGSITGSDTFTILTSTSAITGLFANISPGQRLASQDLFASFIVNYGAGSAFGSDKVVLSSFLNLTPEPSRAMLIVMGMTSLMMRRRRTASRRTSASLLHCSA